MELFEVIKFFLYLLFRFDTNFIVTRNLRGGASVAAPPLGAAAGKKLAEVAVPPGEAAAPGEAAGASLDASSNAGNSGNSESKSVNNKISNIEDSENSEGFAGQNFITWLINEIKMVAIGTLKFIKSKIMFWIVIPVMFASLSPAIPFFGVMAFMTATMKYILWHFRKL